MSSKSMKRGPKIDQIGRLDHTKECDQRAKNKRDWLNEYENEVEDILEAYEESLEHPDNEE